MLNPALRHALDHTGVKPYAIPILEFNAPNPRAHTMPPLPGFSSSPLQTRAELVEAAEAFLSPLATYTSPGCSRVQLPFQSGTLYDETAAQLEGFARPLWVTGSLLANGECTEESLTRLITGLSNGTDPRHPEYWGDIGDMDQRMVETESISFTLLASPRHVLWDRLENRTRHNIAKWFLQLNGKQLPRVNWLWFRVFTNLVLVTLCELDTPEIREQMDTDLTELDSFYLEDGWSSDGKWRAPDLDDAEWDLFRKTGRVHSIKPDRCADYYSGSFAIQFSQLLYVRFAGDMDPERTSRYMQQARDFGAQIWRYFDDKGAAIPFGRSMIYRFCCASFFAALGVASVPNMPEPLSRPGDTRGFLLRHLRWWSQRSSSIFHVDGTLNLGWLYPNMYLTEDYNSPQSVFWALKSFIAIMVPSTHKFWTDSERPYPSMASTSPVFLCSAPRQILCNRPGSHHFLLSSAQFTSLPWKGAATKYGKFAYSSSFGFSVPTGNSTLQQLAPDNTLAFSRDGKQSWTTKWKCREPILGTCTVYSRGGHVEQLPTMSVIWYPWEDRGVSVLTLIIPPSARWPDWHIRLHRIRVNDGSVRTLHFAEGGFAICGQSRKDNQLLLALPPKASNFDHNSSTGDLEGFTLEDGSCAVFSQAGSSGITATLTRRSGLHIKTEASALKPEANTNIVAPRSLIPLVAWSVTDVQQDDEFLLCSSIFAQSSQSALKNMASTSPWTAWLDQPCVGKNNADVLHVSEYISFRME